MPSPTPTLETVISAIKTEMEAISPTIGTVLARFHTLEDDVEFLRKGGYISSGSANVFFIEKRSVDEVEGDATGEVYELYQIEIRYWSIRTGNADWSKEAREKAEAVRDKLSGNAAVFRIGGECQLLGTPETVQIESHGQESIRGTEGDQMIYVTVLSLTVEARRWT